MGFFSYCFIVELKRDLVKDIAADTSGDFQKALLALVKVCHVQILSINFIFKKELIVLVELDDICASARETMGDLFIAFYSVLKKTPKEILLCEAKFLFKKVDI